MQAGSTVTTLPSASRRSAGRRSMAAGQRSPPVRADERARQVAGVRRCRGRAPAGVEVPPAVADVHASPRSQSCGRGAAVRNPAQARRHVQQLVRRPRRTLGVTIRPTLLPDDDPSASQITNPSRLPSVTPAAASFWSPPPPRPRATNAKVTPPRARSRREGTARVGLTRGVKASPKELNESSQTSHRTEHPHAST